MMKSHVLAAGAHRALASAASAPSNVTLFGVIDVGAQYLAANACRRCCRSALAQIQLIGLLG
jgi:hypothetical protein